jgi:hypothetical protein
MKCYHCANEHQRLTYQVLEAVGVCQQCGEAVCIQHGVKSDVPLPRRRHSEMEKTHPVLLPLLCADCYRVIKSAALARKLPLAPASQPGAS